METVNWKLLLLRDNPFSITPPEDPNDLVWAGLPELKQNIQQKLLEAERSSVTQAILNRGPFGGGKTHALRYYSLIYNWPKAGNERVRDIFVVSVPTPKETGKADKDFYVDVLERLGMPRIRQTVATAIREVGTDTAQDILQKLTDSENIARAICMLAKSDSLVQDELFRARARSERDILLDAYFLDGCSKTELRKLGLARNIDKSQDRFRVLAGLIHCFIGLLPGRDIATHSRFCLWVDELEDLVYFTAAQFRPFTQGLRDLIDRLPNFFSLLLNFTLTEPEELDTIEIVMGKALVDRITDHVIFREMTQSQALQYIQEIMAFWRTEQPETQGLSLFYPFEAEALHYLIETLDKRTPRSVNKRCRNAAVAALRTQHGEVPGDIRVDLPFVKSIARSELDQEMD